MSVRDVVGEEFCNSIIKPCFGDACGEEIVIQRREKLSDIEGDYTSLKVFCPAGADNVGKIGSSMCHGSLLYAS